MSKKKLDEKTNIDLYDDCKHFYWVGFPKKDAGNDSDDSFIIENANPSIYDRKGEGSVSFLNSKWIK